MNKEQQRIKIAGACGYSKGWDYRTATPWNEWCIKSLPDYLNDLNAMHEAMKTLSPKMGIEFCFHLNDMGISGEWDMLTATAAQRAEAFLKTIKKWNSDKI